MRTDTPDGPSRRLLLVDQGEEHAKKPIARRLAHLGYRLTLVQWNSAVWERELFERVFVSRLTNWSYLAGILGQEHGKDPFAGVVCYNEGALTVADEIARLLGLPRLSRFDAESFRHKDRMRVAWEAASVPGPRFRVIHGQADVRVLSTWRFPVVLKPAAMMGSKGVIRVDTPEEAYRALPGVLAADIDIPLGGELWTLSEAFNLPAVALAEEYVPGPEYSAEGVVIGGQYQLLGLTCKILTEEPYFDEVGHVFPAPALPEGLEGQVAGVLGRAHTALGMLNAVTHCEFRVASGRIVLMELNARLAGDYIPMLVDEVLGTDMTDLMARCAASLLTTGEVAGYASGAAGHVAAIAFLTGPPAAYGQRLVKLRVPALPGGCAPLSSASYVASGEIVPFPVGSGTTRLGHVAFTAPGADEALEAVHLLRRETEAEHAAP